MNRRDFLLLRIEPREPDSEPRQYELSCQRFYMRWLDADATRAGDAPAGEAAEASVWGGEPPAVFDRPTRHDLFEDLDRELRGVDVLRIVDKQWLVGDLKHDVDRLIDAFRARGGRVL